MFVLFLFISEFIQFSVCVTGGDAAIAMFAVDKEPLERVCSASALVDNAEMCLMTPPRQSVSNTLQWTPTANLKLLLKAASPDLHSREMSSDRCNLNEASQSKADVAVPVVTAADDCSMHSNADVMITDEYAENVTVSMEKQRRKDKSLGLLCER